MQDALNFASDYPKAKNKSRIFMWKLHELIAEYKIDHPDFTFSLKKKKPQVKKEKKQEMPR